MNVLRAAPDGALFAGTDSGLYRSTDLGESWRRYGDRDLISDIAFPEGMDLLVISNGYLHRIIEQGATWRHVITPGAPTAQYLHLALGRLGRIYVWNSSYLYRSTNAGARGR